MGKSSIGLFSCVGMIVAGCIGSAIFSLSGQTMYYAGAACIISWILAAVIQGVYGAEVAELSLHYGKSSGIYVFPARALGKAYGFAASWGYVVANIIAISFSAIYIGIYLGVSFEGFGEHQVAIALASIALCALLNMFNVKNMGRFNLILLALLAALMIAYSVVALSHPNFSFGKFVPFFQGSKGRFGFITAIPNALVAYGSVVSVAFIVENVRNPRRTIPLSLLIGLGIVVVLYLLMLVSTLGHISYGFLEKNEGMRYIPMFAASWSSMGDVRFLPAIVSLGAVLALLTTMLVLGYLTAVAMRGMAQDGVLPGFLTKSSRNDAPWASIAAYAVVSCALAVKPSITELLVNLGSLVSVITMVVVIASFIKVRSDGKPFSAGNMVGYATIAVMLACYVPGIASSGWSMWVFTFAVYAIGFCVYRMCSGRIRRNKAEDRPKA